MRTIKQVDLINLEPIEVPIIPSLSPTEKKIFDYLKSQFPEWCTYKQIRIAMQDEMDTVDNKLRKMQREKKILDKKKEGKTTSFRIKKELLM